MRTMLLVAALLLSFASRAGDGADLAAAMAQQREIRAAIDAKDPRFAYLADSRRQNVRNAQDRLFAMTEGKGTLQDLPVNDQVRVFNQLKRIEALLVRRDVDNREVCEKATLTGTKRQQLVCYNKAEQDARADRAREALMQRTACTEPGCI